jgi:hypothetical protein
MNCIIDTCIGPRLYNFIGTCPYYCRLHRKPGMRSNPLKRCEKCDEYALYGIEKPIWCKLHANLMEYNRCDLTTNLQWYL